MLSCSRGCDALHVVWWLILLLVKGIRWHVSTDLLYDSSCIKWNWEYSAYCKLSEDDDEKIARSLQPLSFRSTCIIAIHYVGCVWCTKYWLLIWRKASPYIIGRKTVHLTLLRVLCKHTWTYPYFWYRVCSVLPAYSEVWHHNWRV